MSSFQDAISTIARKMKAREKLQRDNPPREPFLKYCMPHLGGEQAEAIWVQHPVFCVTNVEVEAKSPELAKAPSLSPRRSHEPATFVRKQFSK